MAIISLTANNKAYCNVLIDVTECKLQDVREVAGYVNDGPEE